MPNLLGPRSRIAATPLLFGAAPGPSLVVGSPVTRDANRPRAADSCRKYTPKTLKGKWPRAIIPPNGNPALPCPAACGAKSAKISGEQAPRGVEGVRSLRVGQPGRNGSPPNLPSFFLLPSFLFLFNIEGYYAGKRLPLASGSATGTNTPRKPEAVTRKLRTLPPGRKRKKGQTHKRRRTHPSRPKSPHALTPPPLPPL